MPVTVRAATDNDAEAACQVLRRSITELCATDHQDDEEVLAAWLRNKTPEHVRSWLRSSNLCMIVAVREGSVCGVSMISRQGEIQLCYASPDVRFLGVGKLMLHTLQAQALEWGLSEVFLTSTVTGKSFYERNGFASDGIRIRSESSAVRNVYPMVKRIGP